MFGGNRGVSLARQGVDFGVARCLYIGGARAAGKERQLAHRLARFDFSDDPPVGQLHVQAPRADEVERVGLVAITHQKLAALDEPRLGGGVERIKRRRRQT